MKFFRRLSDGSTYLLGVATEQRDGWRFISNVSAHKSSRKWHPTMERCIPRWVGYPSKCETLWPVTDWPVVESDRNQWKEWSEA